MQDAALTRTTGAHLQEKAKSGYEIYIRLCISHNKELGNIIVGHRTALYNIMVKNYHKQEKVITNVVENEHYSTKWDNSISRMLY